MEETYFKYQGNEKGRSGDTIYGNYQPSIEYQPMKSFQPRTKNQP